MPPWDKITEDPFAAVQAQNDQLRAEFGAPGQAPPPGVDVGPGPGPGAFNEPAPATGSMWPEGLAPQNPMGLAQGGPVGPEGLPSYLTGGGASPFGPVVTPPAPTDEAQLSQASICVQGLNLAQEGDDGLVWKVACKTGTLALSPGPGQTDSEEPLNLTGEMFRQMVLSLEEQAFPYCTVPETHGNGSLENTGYVRRAEILTHDEVMTDPRVAQRLKQHLAADPADTEYLLAGIEFTEPEVKRKALNGSIPDTSIGVKFGYRNKRTGKQYPVAWEHLALTPVPWVDGLVPFGLSQNGPYDQDNDIPTKSYLGGERVDLSTDIAQRGDFDLAAASEQWQKLKPGDRWSYEYDTQVERLDLDGEPIYSVRCGGFYGGEDDEPEIKLTRSIEEVAQVVLRGVARHEEREARMRAQTGQPVALGLAIDFNPSDHPRDLKGQFRKTVGGLKPGESANLPDGTSVIRKPAGEEGMDFKVVGKGGTYEHNNPERAANRGLEESARSTHKDSLGGGVKHPDVDSALRAHKAVSKSQPKDDRSDEEKQFGAVTRAVDRLTDYENPDESPYTGAADEIRDIFNQINGEDRGMDVEAEEVLQEIADATENSKNPDDKPIHDWAKSKLTELQGGDDGDGPDAEGAGDIDPASLADHEVYPRIQQLRQDRDDGKPGAAEQLKKLAEERNRREQIRADHGQSPLDDIAGKDDGFDSREAGAAEEVDPMQFAMEASTPDEFMSALRSAADSDHMEPGFDQAAHDMEQLEEDDPSDTIRELRARWDKLADEYDLDPMGNSKGADGDLDNKLMSALGTQRIQVDVMDADSIQFNFPGGDDEYNDYEISKGDDGKWALTRYPLDMEDEDTSEPGWTLDPENDGQRLAEGDTLDEVLEKAKGALSGAFTPDEPADEKKPKDQNLSMKDGAGWVQAKAITTFDPKEHPRDWRGRFSKLFASLKPHEKVSIGGSDRGTTVERTEGDQFKVVSEIQVGPGKERAGTIAAFTDLEGAVEKAGADNALARPTAEPDAPENLTLQDLTDIAEGEPDLKAFLENPAFSALDDVQKAQALEHAIGGELAPDEALRYVTGTQRLDQRLEYTLTEEGHDGHTSSELRLSQENDDMARTASPRRQPRTVEDVLGAQQAQIERTDAETAQLREELALSQQRLAAAEEKLHKDGVAEKIQAAQARGVSPAMLRVAKEIYLSDKPEVQYEGLNLSVTTGEGEAAEEHTLARPSDIVDLLLSVAPADAAAGAAAVQAAQASIDLSVVPPAEDKTDLKARQEQAAKAVEQWRENEGVGSDEPAA